MYQSYSVTSTPQFGRARVESLRAEMAKAGIDGLLVPRADEYQGEYVPASAERLSWLTGFTGSAGVALITKTQAIVFVDGRYVTQLKEQVDGTVFTGGDLIGEPPHLWLSKYGTEGFRLGIDPWLHTNGELRRLEKAVAALNGGIVLLSHNLVDAIWSDRPAEPLGKVAIQNYTHAGTLAKDKLAMIAEGLATAKADAALITDPSSVAWTFNLRGADVPHTPHPLARAIVHSSGKVDLFLDKRKTGAEQEAYLAQICDQRPPSELGSAVSALGKSGARILTDPDLTPVSLTELIKLSGGTVVEGVDPAKLPRACKNTVELSGSAAAHVQDGAAMVHFLAWLDAQQPGTITEIAAAERLEQARVQMGEAQQNPLKDISFDTISGAGEHAAIMHYRVTTETDRLIKPGEMFLIDSGAQYVNGTTDITRTVAIGNVPEEQKRFFTLVLKGMIAISVARFPKGSRGCDLDPLARISLWKAGADFAHGTGHGVGSYLSVHEGPQRISRASQQELLPGMILSNEPGYYRPGAFGIRIENLVWVKEASSIDVGDMPMLGFETLTWCPIDKRLILTDLLTREEIHWLDTYHADTRNKLMPLVSDPSVQAWLVQATEPFARDPS